MCAYDISSAETHSEATRGAGRRGPDGLRALDRAMTILFTLAENPEGMSLADLSRTTELSTPTVHRMLNVLRTRDLVRLLPNGNHSIGVSSVRLSWGYISGLDLRAEALPVMKALHSEMNETCNLGILASPHIVYIEQVESSRQVRMVSRVGATMPALNTAMGKVLLAWSGEEALDSVLNDSSEQLGLVTDLNQLREEFQQIRTLGYATDLEINEPGICCIGAPVRDVNGDWVAALSVSFPSSRFDYDAIDELGARIHKASDELSTALGYLPEVHGVAPGK